MWGGKHTMEKLALGRAAEGSFKGAVGFEHLCAKFLRSHSSWLSWSAYCQNLGFSSLDADGNEMYSYSFISSLRLVFSLAVCV